MLVLLSIETKTFDVECPAELATWLEGKIGTYEHRQMTGVEFRPEDKTE